MPTALSQPMVQEIWAEIHWESFTLIQQLEDTWLCKENLDPELSQCLWIRNCTIQSGFSLLNPEIVDEAISSDQTPHCLAPGKNSLVILGSVHLYSLWCTETYL